MRQESCVIRVLLVAGLAAMLIGAIDPLEGSVVVLVGLGIVALAARLRHSRYRALIYWSFAVMATGVGAMYGLSAIGGTGGGSGRSHWWALVIVPYPVGWVAGLVGGVRALREIPGRAARDAAL